MRRAALKGCATPRPVTGQRTYHWVDASGQREGWVIRHTFVASAVCVSALAAIGSVAGLAAGQQNSDIPAAARNYWAFKLPVQAPLPEGSVPFQHPIDRFLEAARQEK